MSEGSRIITLGSRGLKLFESMFTQISSGVAKTKEMDLGEEDQNGSVQTDPQESDERRNGNSATDGIIGGDSRPSWPLQCRSRGRAARRAGIDPISRATRNIAPQAQAGEICSLPARGSHPPSPPHSCNPVPAARDGMPPRVERHEARDRNKGKAPQEETERRRRRGRKERRKSRTDAAQALRARKENEQEHRHARILPARPTTQPQTRKTQRTSLRACTLGITIIPVLRAPAQIAPPLLGCASLCLVAPQPPPPPPPRTFPHRLRLHRRARRAHTRNETTPNGQTEPSERNGMEGKEQETVERRKWGGKG
ncbi:hypothetical protein DFH09DRAFT_1089945 [Mycena vulgaris]|nr:hypothetical protein DFH09DRAFT_1089945 [Mycena vulgaris]